MKNLAAETPTLADKIMAIMASGNELDEQNKKDEAQALYQKAWDLLPEPKLGRKRPWMAESQISIQVR